MELSLLYYKVVWTSEPFKIYAGLVLKLKYPSDAIYKAD